ncbi:hypothetical protein MNB_SM-3-399 [hydrothermal vent metagenome]|uniref:DUF2335 domain-containing protein n=1 Tax=hydrothermal vent metagenome TaxID=652676 RepID=A0A1W1D1X4_9ZZZZ
MKNQEEDILSRLSVQTTHIRQAPIPPPEELRQLKQIDKTLPDRIIAMAEKEQIFRHRATYFGQLNFILLVSLGYGIATIAGFFGSQVVGGIIATGVSYIAYVFKTHQPTPPKQNRNED